MHNMEKKVLRCMTRIKDRKDDYQSRFFVRLIWNFRIGQSWGLFALNNSGGSCFPYQYGSRWVGGFRGARQYTNKNLIMNVARWRWVCRVEISSPIFFILWNISNISISVKDIRNMELKYNFPMCAEALRIVTWSSYPKSVGKITKIVGWSFFHF